jgi:aspartyl-tRNA(Asn)/glutamyl-tRNA(Gln) amidotransferase subunit C
MSVDDKTVRRIATLARIEQLREIDVENVPPMTSVVEHSLRMREDNVTEENTADALMKNAPEAEDHFFVVPKVVE